MLTEEEKKLLLQLLNSAQVTCNRQTIAPMLEKLDALARKILAMPTEKAETPKSIKKK